MFAASGDAQGGVKAMARVRNISASELPHDLAVVYEQFSEQYGPFRNQAAVFAHVPAALRHLMPMLIELREAASLPKRVLELAIVKVSQLNACHYCVAHHTPFLVVEGLSAAGVRRLLDYRDHPELDARDKLVVEICDSRLGTAEPHLRGPIRTAPRTLQRSADCRVDPAHHTLRLLQ
jgi:AhpD family alkylhydroperoxidase